MRFDFPYLQRRIQLALLCFGDHFRAQINTHQILHDSGEWNTCQSSSTTIYQDITDGQWCGGFRTPDLNHVPISRWDTPPSLYGSPTLVCGSVIFQPDAYQRNLHSHQTISLRNQTVPSWFRLHGAWDPLQQSKTLLSTTRLHHMLVHSLECIWNILHARGHIEALFQTLLDSPSTFLAFSTIGPSRMPA